VLNQQIEDQGPHERSETVVTPYVRAKYAAGGQAYRGRGEPAASVRRRQCQRGTYHELSGSQPLRLVTMETQCV